MPTTRAPRSATRLKQTEQDMLADARHVLALLDEHAADFKAADKGRQVKLLPDAVVKQLAEDVEAGDAAVGGAATQKQSKAAATAGERAQGKVVFDLLTSIRDEIAAAYPDDKVLQRAFGTGAGFTKGSTPSLSKAAALVISSYGEPKNKKAAAAAGITPARIADLKKAAKALADADTDQSKQQSGGRATTRTKATIFKSLRAGVTRARKAAKVVFKSKPDVLAKWKTAVARRAPRKRVVKKPE